MSDNPNRNIHPNQNNQFYGSFNQEKPRSLIDPYWSYNQAAFQPTYVGPQYPTPTQQNPTPTGPSQTRVGFRGPSKFVSSRPVCPKTSHKEPVGPKNETDWLDKLDRDATSTVLDFQQATEEGGFKFSDRLKVRLDNAKIVGGDIMNSICKAATSSQVEGATIGIEGSFEESSLPSLAEQVLAIEKLEHELELKKEQVRRNQ